METTERNPTNWIWIVAVLIGMGLAGGLYWSNKRALTEQYDQAEQRADSLLSVKFQLEGDNRDLKKQLETATDETVYLTSRIHTLQEQGSQRNRIVHDLHQSNKAQTRTIQNLNQTLSQQATVRDSLENQMIAMLDKINWQSRSNELLLRQKNELEQKQTDLDTRIVTMVPRSAITADAFQVVVSKPNKKVTAKSKKANTLTVSLSVPATLNLEGMQAVYLSLTDEQRKPMIPALRSTTVALPGVNEVVPVHAEQTVNFARNPQRVSFSLMPEAGIRPGTYQASVYTKDSYLGTVKFQLRDSFWFF